MSEIQVYHNSYEEYYRQPFGAVPCGRKVILRISIMSDAPVEECLLRLWEKEKLEKILPMQVRRKDGEEKRLLSQVFEVDYAPPLEPGIVWYFFKFKIGNQIYYYGNNKEELGGVGVLSHQECPSYQITVYKPSLVPQWFKKGIMYQIFVDRFFNGNSQGSILNPKKKSILHGDWQDTPFYIKDEKGRVVRWTFFGGNLQGVREKLPYLEELGITVIYFNPIFEAASNHKYDTGDYLKIDPMYGDQETFNLLVREAKGYGISIILDGVFSHTGSDSIYFNRYGSYPSLGAYQSEESPYYKWYRLKECQGEYECWWGVDDLPNVDELEPSYRDFIFEGEDSVVKYWAAQGIKGWRLDVADELPDEFVKGFRKSLKEADPQAVLIGEVWEDASRKVSYGKRREYFLGDELDSAMNYPLRSILLDFILGKSIARDSVQRIMSLYENYPRENFLAAMNLLGSHDRIRILTLLGEAPDEGSLTETERENYKLPIDVRNKAAQRLNLLALMQMTLPGVPCIYYGDEVGVEGFSDPYNRGTYPWGKEDRQILEWYKRLIRLRKEYDLWQEGEFTPFHLGTEVLGFRTIKMSEGKYEEIIVCINRSSTEEFQTEIEVEHYCPAGSAEPSSLLVLDLLAGEKIDTDLFSNENGGLGLRVTLKPLEGKVFYILGPGQSNLSPIFTRFERTSGLLLHITSLPSPWGIGDLGEEAQRFVDFLAAAGQRLWQILPLNPLGEGYSPYQSPSVFAGNTLLISLDSLREEGLLTPEEVSHELRHISQVTQGQQYINSDKVDYPMVEEVKDRLLRRAFSNFQVRMDKEKDSKYQDFLGENEHWLEDYSLYQVLKEQTNGLAWYEWERPFLTREAEILKSQSEEFKEEIEYQYFLQYTFFSQWQNLKKYANSKGIQIIGDLPIYVAGDSCDTWVHREYFSLDPKGKPTSMAGVPPDYFCEKGQLWGNPLYAWKRMEKEGYSWWKDRIRQVLKNYDFIRLDHFRGFEAFWEVPAGESTAVDGRWLKGPGKKFFEALNEEFGKLPFIAEDLGFLTPEVHNLKNVLGFPGMKVYQFEAPLQEGKEAENPELEITGLENTVFYSGTHDNDTLLGWYRKKLYKDNKAELPPEQRERVYKEILAKIYQSKAPWVIIPMQDILGLDSEGRMNTPGTVQGNWGWRLKDNDLTEDRLEWLRTIATESGRVD